MSAPFADRFYRQSNDAAEAKSGDRLRIEDDWSHTTPEVVAELVERVRKAEAERDEAVSKAMVWAKSCADANERAERAEAEVAFLKENRLPGLEADAAALDRAEAVIAEAKLQIECDEPGDAWRILSGYEP